MKRLAWILPALLLLGCSRAAPPVPATEKEALRRILDAKFTVASGTHDDEDELYRVLAAFQEGRAPDERVLAVDFTSGSEARIRFLDSGPHGGGVALAQKRHGKWTIVQKDYFV